MKKRMKLPVSDREFTDLLAFVRAELANQGFDAEADPEWETPIVDGCWAACLYFANNPVHRRPPVLASLKTLAIRFSVAKASRHLEQLKRLRLGDEAGARRESMPPVKTGLGEGFSIEDRDIINFVEAHGQGRAARMLMMSPAQMRNLLEDIALRVRANLAT